jgi:hypothetical protein
MSLVGGLAEPFTRASAPIPTQSQAQCRPEYPAPQRLPALPIERCQGASRTDTQKQGLRGAPPGSTHQVARSHTRDGVPEVGKEHAENTGPRIARQCHPSAGAPMTCIWRRERSSEMLSMGRRVAVMDKGQGSIFDRQPGTGEYRGDTRTGASSAGSRHHSRSGVSAIAARTRPAAARDGHAANPKGRTEAATSRGNCDAPIDREGIRALTPTPNPEPIRTL